MPLSEIYGQVDDKSTGMTLREVFLYFEGCEKRDERSMRVTAWHASNIMACFAKPPSIDEMLGVKKKSRRRQMFDEDMAEREAELNRLAKEEAEFFEDIG